MDAYLFYALVFFLIFGLAAWAAEHARPEPEPVEPPCPVCNDERADIHPWDINDNATPILCKGCGGLIGVEA